VGQRGHCKTNRLYFFYGKETKISNRSRMFVHHRLVSAVKTVEVVSDSVSYIFQRGRWCNIIVLNVHAPSEEKNDYKKDSSYEEVFDHFSKYHKKMLYKCNE